MKERIDKILEIPIFELKKCDCSFCKERSQARTVNGELWLIGTDYFIPISSLSSSDLKPLWRQRMRALEVGGVVERLSVPFEDVYNDSSADVKEILIYNLDLFI